MNEYRRTLLSLGASFAALTIAPSSSAQPPSRQLRVIVPYAPGGIGDTLVRTLADRMFNQQAGRVIVENRAGGATVIGTQAALTAPADGATMLMVAASFVIQPQLFSKTPYNVQKDFVPVCLVASNPHLLVVHPSVPASNLKEFIAWAKFRNGAAAYASFGNGSSGHLGFELLKKAGGFDMVHAAYKGGAPAIQDLLGGQVSAMLTDLPQAVQHVKSGKLKAIAVGAQLRAPALPEVPTFAEAGVPNFQSQSWYGLVMRAGTPPEVVEQLNGVVNVALKDDKLKSILEPSGLELIGGSSEQFRQFLDKEAARYQQAIAAAKIIPE